MGEIVQLNCMDCQCGGHFKIGAGMMSTQPDIVETQLRGEDLEKWQQLSTQDQIRFSAWKYELTYCDDCQKMQSSFVVDICTKDGEKLSLGNRCNQCHKQLEPMKWKEDMICPSCGRIFAVKSITGRWD